MIFWLEKAGCVIGISAGVMGIVFGAAGTSIPDCLCSLYVARRGFGDMAITNVFGSNVFDILFALALPWMLGMHMSGRTIEVQNSTGLTIWMAGTLLVFILQSVATKCTYNKWHGYCYVILYLLFIIYNFINDTFHFAG
jgi:Ca2+/Na+ antiporter